MGVQSDPEAVSAQYASGRNLVARQSLYAYQRSPVVLWEWAFDTAGLTGDESVLDVGCGNGNYVAELARRDHRGPVVALDQSYGMLTTVATTARTRADAQALPFPDGAFDVVLAIHMLYHVPDWNRAIDELRRVLRPGGIALVLTNFTAHLRELYDLFGRDLGVPFAVENGRGELERAFATVELHETRGVLEIDDIEPVRAYVESMMVEVDLDDGLQRTADVLARDGVVRVQTACGLFVCR